jgi:hypothetical protein
MDKITFASAYNRLKDIHKQLSSQDNADIDGLLALQKEAKELHDFLMQRLHDIDPEHEKHTPTSA